VVVVVVVVVMVVVVMVYDDACVRVRVGVWRGRERGGRWRGRGHLAIDATTTAEIRRVLVDSLREKLEHLVELLIDRLDLVLALIRVHGLRLLWLWLSMSWLNVCCCLSHVEGCVCCGEIGYFVVVVVDGGRRIVVVVLGFIFFQVECVLELIELVEESVDFVNLRVFNFCLNALFFALFTG
jgi:hypothetical protein